MQLLSVEEASYTDLLGFPYEIIHCLKLVKFRNNFGLNTNNERFW